jgi:hypothetical protein
MPVPCFTVSPPESLPKRALNHLLRRNACLFCTGIQAAGQREGLRSRCFPGNVSSVDPNCRRTVKLEFFSRFRVGHDNLLNFSGNSFR